MADLRTRIIKLAFEQPHLREHLLPVLRKEAMEFPTKEALEDYLEDHPGADRANHKVKNQGGTHNKESQSTKGKTFQGLLSQVKMTKDDGNDWRARLKDMYKQTDEKEVKDIIQGMSLGERKAIREEQEYSGGTEKDALFAVLQEKMR